MKSALKVTLGILIATLVAVPLALSMQQDDDDDDDAGAALISELKSATLPLEHGVSASAREGTPISAKYEIEDGKMQLSVYTMKGETFNEVIVDHTTGQIAKVIPITEGDDLRAAQRQKEVMARKNRSLEAVAADAVKTSSGYRAVSVMPSLKDGYPVVEVILVNGNQLKAVTERLQEDD